MKGQYTKAELLKPFAISRTAFSPDYNNPEVRKAMLEQGMNSVSNMFGSQPMIGLPSQETEIISADIFDMDADELDNPAFASDGEVVTEFTDTVNDDVEPEPPAKTEPIKGDTKPGDVCDCSRCGKGIKENVADYSLNKFKTPLCFTCQKEVEQEEQTA